MPLSLNTNLFSFLELKVRVEINFAESFYQAGNSTQGNLLCMTGARIMEPQPTQYLQTHPQGHIVWFHSFLAWIYSTPSSPGSDVHPGSLPTRIQGSAEMELRSWSFPISFWKFTQKCCSQWWDNMIWYIHKIHKNMENSSHQLPVELGIGRTWSQEEQVEQAPSPRKQSRDSNPSPFPVHH